MMAIILVSLCVMFLFTKELTGIKCFACDPGSDCRKHMKEEKCPTEPLLKDKCIEIMNNENEQVARGCANTKMCQTAEKNCKEAKQTRTGDCDVTCCAADLCNAGSKRVLSLMVFVLCLLIYVLLSNPPSSA